MTRARGFTLIELMVALALLALMAGILVGSLSLSGRSLESGEHKAEATANMRLTQEFLRMQLEGQQPMRWRKIAEFPLLFGGENEELRFAAALPERVAGGGVWYYRLAVGRNGDRTPLVLERVVPDVNALDPQDFRDADRSVLVDDVAELRVGYFGREQSANDATVPTWRDRWDDKQRMPLVVRIDVKPKNEPAWPTLYVSPRQSPEAGCRAWDAARQRCANV